MVFDFLPSASHLIIFRLEVIFMDYANYHLGIGVAIASIAIILMLAISNPGFFLASIVLLIGLECLK